MKDTNVAHNALKCVIGILLMLTLSTLAICSPILEVKVLTIVQDGDTLSLIEERHLDSLGNTYDQAINNLELQLTEYAIQVELHKTNGQRYEVIAANTSVMIQAQAITIEEQAVKIKRAKIKAGIGTAFGLILGILIAK